ncbi:MAG: sodium:alanine symporter, partial [Pseudomonadota bacterium]|nr:sodium:alanine symporter [Pseudomonadota bacterium]
MQTFVDTLNSYIWSNALIIFALGAGLFFSLKTKFVQIRLLKEMIRLLLSGTSSKQGISSFQALAVSLSG